MHGNERIKALFQEALDLDDPALDRVEWLKQRSATDDELFEEVRSLLEAHARMLLEARPGPFPTSVVPSGQFGAYRAIEVVGRGGTSAVYRAERADGKFRQTVALKIMASYLRGAEFLRRFDTERQMLASLSHPHITHLLDGGVSPGGDPYLIMEFVEGEPIDRYCDKRKVDVQARLRIFLQVCDAVDYAHRNLVVHRDLKPGNILVNADGQVKLLDFGTASLLTTDADPPVTGRPLVTPRYASPEQLRGQRINTATDIFSLGVVLFELVCGAWPFGESGSVLSELNRMMGETPAKPPATVVTVETAECRSVSKPHLAAMLRGDLSAIVLKALENDPGRRYESVRLLAADIENFLTGRPVMAHPQTVLYRSRRFVRRHWLSVSSALVFVSGLVLATGVAIYQAREARTQAARAHRVSEFAKDTFLAASSTWTSPLSGKSHAIQFSDILDNAVERVGTELRGDPEAEADLRGTLGSTYSILGDPRKGEAQLRLAIQRLEGSADRASPVAADLRMRLCDTLSYQWRFAEALNECRESLRLARLYGSGFPMSGILHDTAYITAKSGAPLEDAEKLFREAAGPVDARREKLWPAMIDTRVGRLRLRQGDLDEGDRILDQADHLLRTAPGPPMELVPVLAGKAFGARVRGRYDEAIKLLHEAVDMLTQRPTPYLEPDKIEIELAAAEALAGQKEALTRLRKYEKELDVEKSSPLDWSYLEMLAGIVEQRCGFPDSAEERLRAALSIAKKEGRQQPADRVEIYVRLAQLLVSSGRRQEAGEVAREGLQVAERAYGAFFDAHPLVVDLRGLAAP
ncbi:MAG: serine/threonine-protein kinase [Bryobacteraceae bacterium]